jgi:hypothetical protein
VSLPPISSEAITYKFFFKSSALISLYAERNALSPFTTDEVVFAASVEVFAVPQLTSKAIENSGINSFYI